MLTGFPGKEIMGTRWPPEVEQVHAPGAAGLLADVAKPRDGHQNIGFVRLGDGVARTTSYLPWLIPPEVMMMSGLKLSYSAVRRCSSSMGSSPIAIRRTCVHLRGAWR